MKVGSALHKKFDYLDSLIGTVFHQDYDIFGNTIEEIVASFKKDSMPDEAAHTLSEIKEYLAEHPDDGELERDFYRRFDWGLVEGAFGPRREFLGRIAELLAESN